MFRLCVHRMCQICGALSALCLAGIAIATMMQVVARQTGSAVETTEISGFLLAASTFLGLCYTFINGGHVRIGIISQIAPPQIKRGAEIFCCALALLVSGYMTVQMTLFTIETYQFGDLSPGLLAAPLWIPQSAVAFGLFAFTIAILEQSLLVLRGETADFDTNIDSTE